LAGIYLSKFPITNLFHILHKIETREEGTSLSFNSTACYIGQRASTAFCAQPSSCFVAWRHTSS